LELIIIPFIGALAVFFGGRKQAAPLALLGSLITLAYTLTVLSGFNTDGQFQLITDVPWLNNGIRFRTGLDGIGMLLVLLTHVLIPVIVLLQWKRDEADNAGFFGLVLLMQAALAGVFSALDGLVFYIFWELALIPVWFICARWGGENRLRITLKFFIYTFLGSVFMLASLLYLYFHTPGDHSFAWEALTAVNLSGSEAMWVGAGLLLAFFIKIPVFPFHTWQPDTYTVSPATGTMLLSGIMLKMGLFGLMRWYLPMVPEASGTQLPIAGTMALIGVVYGGIIALRQSDMKRISAYASMSHVGLIAAGIFTLSPTGMQGAMLQMFSHGVNIVGLFACIAIIENRAGTRDLAQLGGIASQARIFTILFMIVTLGTVAVPLTNGFPGELLLLQSVFQYHPAAGIVAGLTIILCAVYMLRMFQFSMLGQRKGDIYLFRDVEPHELIALGILAALIIAIGFFPQPWLDLTGASVNRLLDIIQERVALR
jgi:NADH-quinone oxidoreductase subunit M